MHESTSFGLAVYACGETLGCMRIQVSHSVSWWCSSRYQPLVTDISLKVVSTKRNLGIGSNKMEHILHFFESILETNKFGVYLGMQQCLNAATCVSARPWLWAANAECWEINLSGELPTQSKMELHMSCSQCLFCVGAHDPVMGWLWLVGSLKL